MCSDKTLFKLPEGLRRGIKTQNKYKLTKGRTLMIEFNAQEGQPAFL